jgi:hypothetical protein
MKVLQFFKDLLKDFCPKYSKNILEYTPNKQSPKGVGVAHDPVVLTINYHKHKFKHNSKLDYFFTMIATFIFLIRSYR